MDVGVSVILPVLNERPNLECCLARLQEQTVAGGSWELLIIDNGSTDGSLEFAEAFATGNAWRANSQIVSVQVFIEERRDVYVARNLGVRHARGDLLAFTDAHCAVSDGWLQKLTDTLVPAAGVAIGRLDVLSDATRALGLYSDYDSARTALVFGEALEDCYYGHGANMAVRRELFLELGAFKPLPLAGDTEFLQRLLASKLRFDIRYEPAAVVSRLSVLTFPDMLVKLANYGGYTQVVACDGRFRALNFSERLAVYRKCLRDGNYSLVDSAYLALLLVAGLGAFNIGQLRQSLRGPVDGR